MSLYKKRNFQPSKEIQIMCSEFLAGYERLLARLKENGEMPVQEGTQPISFAVYCVLESEPLTQSNDFAASIFFH